MSEEMPEKYPYCPTKALICKVLGHRWHPYDFGTDKCLRCNKEGYDAASDISHLASIAKNIPEEEPGASFHEECGDR